MKGAYERIREVFGGVERVVELVEWLVRRMGEGVIFPEVSRYLSEVLPELSRQRRGERRKNFTFKFDLTKEMISPYVTDPQKVDCLFENLEKLKVVVRVECQVIPWAVRPVWVTIKEGWFSVSKSFEPMIEIIITSQVVFGTPTETVINKLNERLAEKKSDLLLTLAHELIHFLDVTFKITVKKIPTVSPDTEREKQSEWMEFLKRLSKVIFFVLNVIKWRLFYRREIEAAEKFAIEMSELTRTLTSVVPSEVRQRVRRVYELVREGRESEVPLKVRRVLNKLLWELIVNFRDTLTRLGYKGDSLRTAKEEVASLFGLSVDELQTLLDLQDRTTGSLR
ncbi:MAG: hypothetical protein QXV20_03920 [Candidatus Hadarchaeales archaeon]